MELASADRMLIRFAVITGVALVAAEWLRSLRRRACGWCGCCAGAAAFCGLVAVLQYWVSLDLAQYLRELPGFALNQDNPDHPARGSLNRVAGTAITSIELGVVAGMLIPIAVCLGLYDRDKTRVQALGARGADRPRCRHVGVALGDRLGGRGVRPLVVLLPPPRAWPFCARCRSRWPGSSCRRTA